MLKPFRQWRRGWERCRTGLWSSRQRPANSGKTPYHILIISESSPVASPRQRRNSGPLSVASALYQSSVCFSLSTLSCVPLNTDLPNPNPDPSTLGLQPLRPKNKWTKSVLKKEKLDGGLKLIPKHMSHLIYLWQVVCEGAKKSIRSILISYILFGVTFLLWHLQAQ